MKLLRRSIIVLCLFFLLTELVYALPEGKYYDSSLKDKVKNNESTVIELNQKGKFDGNTFTAQRIINTSDKTHLRYRLISNGRGWSFAGSFTLFDENHKEYKGFSSGMHGKSWGQEGIVIFDKLPESAKKVTLVVECYDRKLELKLPLNKAGNKNE